MAGERHDAGREPPLLAVDGDRVLQVLHQAGLDGAIDDGLDRLGEIRIQPGVDVLPDQLFPRSDQQLRLGCVDVAVRSTLVQHQDEVGDGGEH